MILDGHLLLVVIPGVPLRAAQDMTERLRADLSGWGWQAIVLPAAATIHDLRGDDELAAETALLRDGVIAAIGRRT